MSQLNERQKIFCHEYIKDWHKQKAAVRAGYAEKGAHVQANALLKNPKVRDYLDQIIEDELGAERSQIRYKSIKKLKDVAFDDGHEDKDALKAIEILGKHSGILDAPDTLNVNVTYTNPADRDARLNELLSKKSER